MPENSKKFFLLSAIVLGVLVVFGLIWAIASGSNEGNEVITFDAIGSPTIGAENPELTVYMFSDLQCPACRAAEQGVRHAIDTYGDRVQFVWKDFPLQSIHANALSAAVAARCAQDQGKFWEYHDRLYNDQPTWSEMDNPVSQFKAYADALGLDKEEFETCYSDEKYMDAVLSDVRQALEQGLSGTPTFYIGDKIFSQVLTPDEWDDAIQAALTSDS